MGSSLGIFLIVFGGVLILYGTYNFLLFFTSFWGSKEIKGKFFLKGIISAVAALTLIFVIDSNPKFFELKSSKPNSERNK